MTPHLPSSVGTVAASGASGLALAGTGGAVIAALAAVVGLFLTVQASGRARRKEYTQEMQAAHDRGYNEAQRDLAFELNRLTDERNYWRTQASGSTHAHD